MKSAVKLKPEERQYIHLSLLHLGVVKWSKSALRLKCAIEYVIETDAIPEVPIGHIYDYLAQKEGSSYGTIERSLRYIVDELWSNDPENCSRLFYRYSYALPCPRVSDFLTVYVSAFQRGIIKEWVDSFEERTSLPEEHERRDAQMLLENMAKINMPV